MRKRLKRVEVIVDLIRNKVIGSQEELLSMLTEMGYSVTQATLSRDLKMLKTTKVPTDRGKYMYMLPDNDVIKDKLLEVGDITSSHVLMTGIISVEFSGNIAVIKTRPGYASGIAYDIDRSKTSEFLGTVPGTDTIFLVVREGVSREEAVEALRKLLPHGGKGIKF